MAEMCYLNNAVFKMKSMKTLQYGWNVLFLC